VRLLYASVLLMAAIGTRAQSSRGTQPQNKIQTSQRLSKYTPAQCRADEDEWSGEITLLDTYTFKQLQKMSSEMLICALSIDPSNGRGYHQTSEVLTRAMNTRYANFLRRHPEFLNQLIAEDEASAR
jgi:hypothetical protein